MMNLNTTTPLVLDHIIPRLLRLGGSSTVYTVDTNEAEYRSVAIKLVVEEEPKIGKSLSWQFYCTGVNGTDYKNSSDFYPFGGMDHIDRFLDFWTLSDNGLSEIVSKSLSSIGSVGIVGLYVTIVVSFGALLRKIIPNPWTLIYVMLSDPLPLLQVINIMEVCRKADYPNHNKDEFRMWYISLKIFRSPDLLARFTKKSPTEGVIVDDDDIL